MKANQEKLTELTQKILDASKGKKMPLLYEMQKKEYLEFKGAALKEIDEEMKQIKSGKTPEQLKSSENTKKYLSKGMGILIMIGMFGRPIFGKLYKMY